MLIVGGQNHSGILNNAELYNPATGKFTATGNMNEARILAQATELQNGMELVAGGEDGGGNTSASAELFNPATQPFTCVGGSLGLVATAKWWTAGYS